MRWAAFGAAHLVFQCKSGAYGLCTITLNFALPYTPPACAATTTGYVPGFRLELKGLLPQPAIKTRSSSVAVSPSGATLFLVRRHPGISSIAMGAPRISAVKARCLRYGEDAFEANVSPV